MKLPDSTNTRRKAVWGPKRTVAIIGFIILGFAPQAFAAGRHPGNTGHQKPGQPGNKAQHSKLDKELTKRAGNQNQDDLTRVIVTLQPGAKLPAQFRKYARKNGKLNLINGHVIDIPNRLLKQLSVHPDVFDVHFDRPIFKHNFRTSLTIGAKAAQQAFGVTGLGVGVAVIDSGVSSWHDDLTTGSAGGSYPYGDQRVAAFVDFVNGQTLPYDDNGHGTHVAGIIAGNGHDSNGQKAGVAPDASIVSLKVLDANGLGNISNIIQALDWVVSNKDQYNIRVVNLSVGAGIHESYWTDPLTLAAKRAVDAGIVVVTAAGNMGKNAAGETQYGGITAPGNAPWVLTVGASSTMGTPTRGDDTIASYSSRGPSYFDYAAKPDLVAPGTGTVSLATPGSTFYATKPGNLLAGLVPSPFTPYLSLSGTSMAAPVVAGTVALMLQADPALTPNGVKAILEYTAQQNANYNALTQGAGFLNTLGAVRLAQFYGHGNAGDKVPVQKMWSKHILWGNHMLKGGLIKPAKNAFKTGVVWGAAADDNGDNIVWGSNCADDSCDNIVWGSNDSGGDDNIVWGSSAANNGGDNIVWGSSASDSDDNIVWGSDCGGDDCDNIVWGSSDPADDNIVWGSAADDGSDNIVWGSSASDSDDNIVWGSSADDGDNIVWGSSGDDHDNIVWGSTAGDDDNIVWGSDCDTDSCDNIVWGSSADGTTVWADLATGLGGSIGPNAPLDKLTDGQLLRLIIAVETHLPVPIPPPPPPPPGDNSVPPPAPPADPSTPPDANAPVVPPPTDPPAPPSTDPTTPPPADPTAPPISTSTDPGSTPPPPSPPIDPVTGLPVGGI